MEAQSYPAAPGAVDEAANSALIEKLNDLLVVLHDSQKGYLTAADDVEDGDYAALFHEYARQREQMAAELAQVVTRYHGEPTKNGSVAGSLQRVWMNIKAAATQGDESIMAECDLAEESALKAYQAVLAAKKLPEDVREVIREHMSLVRLAYERVHALNAALNG